MSRDLKHPPVVEAVAQVQFTPSIDSVVGYLIENGHQVRQRYGGLIKPLSNIQITTGRKSPARVESHIIVEDIGFQLREDGEEGLVQLFSDRATVNVLKEYQGGDDFKNRFVSLLEFLEFRSSVRIQKLSIRYIDRIELDTFPVPLSEVFSFRTHGLTGFVLKPGYELAAPLAFEDKTDGKIRIKVEEGALIVDTDVWRDVDDLAPSSSEMIKIFDSLKKQQVDFFFEVFSERSREEFSR